MPDIESTKTKRYSTKEITENSASVLRGAASDLGIWTQWLDAIAQHPTESANNCAAIMASPYDDTRELRSAREWETLGGTIKPNEAGIPLVHRSKSGNFYVDVQFPASAIEGAHEHYRGLPVRIDLEDEVDGPAFLAATEKWGAELDDANINVAYVIFSRYGIPNRPEPVLPDPEIVSDAKELADYCRELKREAENLIFKFDATIDATRRNIMHPKIDSPKQDERAEKGSEHMASMQVSPAQTDAALASAPQPKVEFNAASHVNDPSSIYSAASSAAKIASSDQMGQVPGNHI